MNFRSIGLVSVLLLLACGQAASEKFNYTQFKEKSLLFRLKADGGSFSSDIELVDPLASSVAHIEEKYSFSLKTGEYVGQEIQRADNSSFTGKLIYLDDLEEIYQIVKGTKQCEEFVLDRPLKDFFLTDWAPEEVFDENANYPILGKQFFEF